MKLRALAGIMAWVLACGGPTPPHTPEPLNGPMRPREDSPANRASVVVGRTIDGVARTTAPARAALEAQLAVVGPEWTHFLGSFRHALRDSSFNWSAPDRLELRLDAAAVERLLADFESQALAVDAPPSWQPTLLAALTAERSYHACQRRQALLAVPCRSAEPGDERLSVVESMSAMVLEPDFPDGVPVNASGVAAWPARVRTWERTEQGLQALPQLALGIEWVVPEYAAEPRVARSDASGVLTLPLGERWERVGVRFANAATLGPLAFLWPGQVVELRTRGLDRERVAVVTLEQSRGQRASTALLSDALLSALSARNERAPITLHDGLSARLLAQVTDSLPDDLRRSWSRSRGAPSTTC